jgi:uncharacterized protein (TIGR02246 family)
MSRKDIEALEQKWQEEFNGGDAAAVARHYAEDARLMPPNAEIVEGRAGIEAFIKEFLALGAKLSFGPIDVRGSGDMFVAIGKYEMDIPTGAEVQKDRGKYLEVYERQADGSLLLVADMFSSDLPAPA